MLWKVTCDMDWGTRGERRKLELYFARPVTSRNLKRVLKDVVKSNRPGKGTAQQMLNIGEGFEDDESYRFTTPFDIHKIKAVDSFAPTDTEGMDRYDDTKGDKQAWCNILQIRVATERDKQQLLKAISYLHDCDIDTDLMAVNSLVHFYQYPERIIVDDRAPIDAQLKRNVKELISRINSRDTSDYGKLLNAARRLRKVCPHLKEEVPYTAFTKKPMKVFGGKSIQEMITAGRAKEVTKLYHRLINGEPVERSNGVEPGLI